MSALVSAAIPARRRSRQRDNKRNRTTGASTGERSSTTGTSGSTGTTDHEVPPSTSTGTGSSGTLQRAHQQADGTNFNGPSSSWGSSLPDGTFSMALASVAASQDDVLPSKPTLPGWGNATTTTTTNDHHGRRRQRRRRLPPNLPTSSTTSIERRQQAARLRQRPSPQLAVYTIMGIAGVTPYMPQTGERPDIGMVTEPQGQYICTSDATALQTVLAQGEARGSMPWHMRDENTGAPLNFTNYPNASWYPDGHSGSPHIIGTINPVTLDSAHMPALVYLPYILTGDPYFLEALQFQANWDWGCMPPSYRPNIPQARAFAWSLRNLMQAARITPTSVPSWLLPQSYWYARLEVTRQFFETSYVNNTLIDRALFRVTGPIDSNPDQGPSAPRRYLGQSL